MGQAMDHIDSEELRKIVQRVLGRTLGNPSSAAPEELPDAKPEPPPAETHRLPENRIVAIGADHGGFELKEMLKQELAAAGLDCIDAGTHSKDAVDYPDVAHKVAAYVGAGKAGRGIIIDGAGIGSCIVANKIPGVRAGLAYDHASAANSRAHNDTNVLTLGAGLIGVNLARQIVQTWLATPFDGGRHARRVEKITAVEKHYLR